MNPNRIQTYINLIQQLLNSSTEITDKILATNQELLDKGLIQTIIMLAQTSAEKGNQEAQELLLTLAIELSEKLEILITENTSATATPFEYLEFLTQVLQATHESKNDPQIIYPILQQNLSKLDRGLAETLQTWATSTLVEIKSEEAYSIAADIVNFSNQIQQFTLGDKANNLEIAITGYKTALTVYNNFSKTHQWANIINNLGTAYLNRIYGDKSVNIEQTIEIYQPALKLIDPEDNPQDWAIIQNNLGNAYSRRIEGDKAKNIEQSIIAYQRALEIITKENFPQQWATIQNNLANTYLTRITGKVSKNIELATIAYQQALNIFTVENFPLECLQIYRKLGDLGFQQENWQFAIESYQVAIKLLEINQSLANTEISYKEILAESIYMYGNIVECYVNIGQYEQALEYVEASRSRRLVELMMINDIYKDEEKPAGVEEYYDLQQQINQLNFDTNTINQPMTVGSKLSIKEIKSENREKIALLKEKQQKIWQKIWSNDRVLAEQLQVTYLSFSDIQQLVKDGETAIIDFYSTRNNTYIFILTQQQLTVHICQGEGIDQLQNWIHDHWLKLYAENSSEWQNQMENFLSELSEKLEFNQLLKQLNEVKELIIIPHLYLHQIPYAALPVTREKETKYLCDYFRLRILPSCQILNYCSERCALRHASRSLITNPRKIGIVETPITNKFYTRYECETLANMYLISPQKRLQYSQAKINNYHNFIQQLQVLHSSHTSQVNLVNSLASKLQLFDGDIPLSKVFAWRLPELFDVFLSSCEINLNQTKISDEILTFASAFISAGARHVISSLWLVEDLATALFCIFYYQHRQKYNRSEALKKAQNQLRYLTGTQLSSYKKQLEGYLEQYMKQENSEKIQQKKELLSWFCQQSLPFTHPYYWAGFISQGIS